MRNFCDSNDDFERHSRTFACDRFAQRSITLLGPVLIGPFGFFEDSRKYVPIAFNSSSLTSVLPSGGIEKMPYRTTVSMYSGVRSVRSSNAGGILSFRYFRDNANVPGRNGTRPSLGPFAWQAAQLRSKAKRPWVTSFVSGGNLTLCFAVDWKSQPQTTPAVASRMHRCVNFTIRPFRVMIEMPSAKYLHARGRGYR